jgi:hypothetical protein
MVRSVRARVLPSLVGPARHCAAPFASRAVRVGNTARDSVPDTSAGARHSRRPAF